MTIFRNCVARRILSLCALACLSLGSPPAMGGSIVKAGTNLSEELFQTLIVMHALKDLGFQVKPQISASYDALHKATANGSVSFIANHWAPLHDSLLAQPGHARLKPTGQLVEQTSQGYLIDRRTAEAHAIDSLEDLKDPKIAALFDTDNNGKANLIGCEQSWSCARVIDHHLNAYGLTDTVEHHQGNYNKLARGALDRLRSREPLLLYVWTPYWVTGELNLSTQVQWLEVPFSALPHPREQQDTAAPNGQNFGFQTNSIHIVANPAFLEANPVATALFRKIRIPIVDIASQNLLMQIGENSIPDIERHARQWIKLNRSLYDQWLAAAKKQ